jgi:hypothetical protein
MTDDENIELRKEAARCARMLVEASRQVPDVREMVMGICGRLGHANIVGLADNDPKSVIDLWDAVQLLEQDSYDAVLKRAKEAAQPVDPT